MKRLKKICFICLIFSLILLNYTVFGATGIITGKTVRLREEASTESKVLSTMKKNEKVEILGEVDNWYNVKFEDKTGYVSKDYVDVEEITDNSSEKVDEKKQEENTSNDNTQIEDNKNTNELFNTTIELGKEYVLQKNTNLRLKPNFSSLVLVELSANDKIIVNNQIGNWIEISISDKKGWILKNAIEVVKVNEEEKPNEEIEQESPKVEEQKPEQENNTKPENENSEKKPDEAVKENTNVDENNSVNKEPAITKGYINEKTVKVRKGPSTQDKMLGLLDLNDEVEIIAEEGDWYKVKTKEYGEGYIAKRLISPTKVASRGENIERTDGTVNTTTDTVSQEKNDELTATLNNSNNLGSEIVNFANQYLGYQYVSGGKKPETGFDCSGFTRYVYSNFGITLGATAASQANNSGNLVARENLQIGDLILFQDEGKTKIGHCGIYIGDNKFIHAANPKRGVVTDKLDGNSYYSTRYVEAYRF